MSDVVLRFGRTEEASSLRDLAERAFREAFSDDIPAPILDDLMARRFTVDRVRGELAEASLGFFVAEVDGQPVGYSVVRPGEGAALWPGPVWELNRIYVLRSHHGTGLGEGLMARAVAHATGAGARSLWLKVLATNLRALAFYRRWGFVEAGREDMDLQGTVLPHLILAKALEG